MSDQCIKLPRAGAGWFRRLVRIISAMAADTRVNCFNPTQVFLLKVLPLPVNGVDFQLGESLLVEFLPWLMNEIIFLESS